MESALNLIIYLIIVVIFLVVLLWILDRFLFMDLNLLSYLPTSEIKHMIGSSSS